MNKLPPKTLKLRRHLVQSYEHEQAHITNVLSRDGGFIKSVVKNNVRYMPIHAKVKREHYEQKPAE